MSPEAKKSTFKDMISKGSIKLRMMSELTEKNGDKVASLYWKETMYKKHEDEMEYEYNKDYEDDFNWSGISRYDEKYAKNIS